MEKKTPVCVSYDIINDEHTEGWILITVIINDIKIITVYPNSCINSSDFLLKRESKNELILSRFTAFTDWNVFKFTYNADSDKWHVLPYIPKSYSEYTNSTDYIHPELNISNDTLLLLINNLCKKNIYTDFINNIRNKLLCDNMLMIKQGYESQIILLDTNISIYQNKPNSDTYRDQVKIWNINKSLAKQKIANIDNKIAVLQ
jgi:hypothetical protein